MKRIAIVWTGLLLGTATACGAQASIGVEGVFLYGPIEGYLQTPRGGGPGTTSAKRPTFDELGLDRVSLFDGSAHVRWDRHTLYGGAQIIRLSGDETLTEPLISQNVTFDAGDRVDSDIQLDWYRFGYLHRFDWWSAHRNAPTLSLGGDAVLFDFHYTLDGAGGHVDRAYAKPAVRLGGELDWRLTERLSMRARAFESLPLSNTPSILSLGLRAFYRLLDSQDCSIDAYVGVSYHRIDYEDDQTVPNHIRAEMGPLFEGGLSLGL